MTIASIVIVISVIILIHEIGHFVAARLSKVRVEEFGIGMFVRLLSFKRGETVYSLNAIPLGGFVRLTGEDGSTDDDPHSFSNKPKLTRIFILTAGVMMNLLLTIVLFTIVFILGMPNWGERIIVSGVSLKSPAEEIGLQSGDVLYQIQGQEVNSVVQFQEITQANLGNEIDLGVKRGEEVLNFQILARKEHPDDEGPLGVKMQLEPIIISKTTYAWYQAPIESLKLTGTMTKEMLFGFGSMLKNMIVSGQKPEGIAGPIGIGQIIGELSSFGIIPVIWFAGILSLNLFVLNLLPFPALDGGRVIFIIIEAIARKKIPARIEGWIHASGMILLLLLIILLTYQDIIRIIH